MTLETQSIPQSQETNTLPYWPNMAIMLAVIALWLGLFFNQVSGAAEIWLNSDTYAHGLFILPLSAWLFWRRKEVFFALKAKPSYLGALTTVVVTLVWLMAQLMEINSLTHLTSFMLLSCLLWLFLGDEFLKRFKFPLAYILFCAPFGNSLIPYLQVITAKFTVYFLELSQIPVFYEGLYITVPTGVFEVAVACSGIRYLIASFAIGSLYAHLSYSHWGKKLAFTAFAIVFPIIANGIRAYLIILIAYLSDMKYATGVDHLVYGWVFFGVVIYLMFLIGNIWADSDKEQDSPKASLSDESISKRRFVVTGIGVLFVMFAVFQSLNLEQINSPEAPSMAAPQQITLHRENDEKSWGVKFDHALNVYHGLSPEGIEAFQAKFAHKQSKGKLITSTNQLFNQDAWSVKTAKIGSQKVSNQIINYAEYVIVRTDGRERIVRYWYRVNEQYFAKKWQVKIAQAMAQILNNGRYGTINALSIEFTNFGDGQAAAQAKLDQWMISNWSVFNGVLNE